MSLAGEIAQPLICAQIGKVPNAQIHFGGYAVYQASAQPSSFHYNALANASARSRQIVAV